MPNRTQVVVTVSDDGPGIPDEIRERIFEPFLTTKSNGTGLGLAITKRIVTAHHGSIQVNSFPGGTMFEVTLLAYDGEDSMSLTILIVDDEETFRKNTENYLTGKGYEVSGVGTLEEAREHLSKGDAELILLDVQLPDGYGPNLLFETANMAYRPPIILMTAYGDIDMAVDAMKNGAHDFLTKPIQFTQLEKSIQRASEIVTMRRELMHFRQIQKTRDFVTGKSANMKTVLSQAQKAAVASVSVLITGETGTGKEVLAKFIYESGPRSGKQFIAINCAAIQHTMLEAELFGYEAGAFTGAERKKHGLMEVADGGVLFPGRNQFDAIGYSGQAPARPRRASISQGGRDDFDQG